MTGKDTIYVIFSFIPALFLLSVVLGALIIDIFDAPFHEINFSVKKVKKLVLKEKRKDIREIKKEIVLGIILKSKNSYSKDHHLIVRLPEDKVIQSKIIHFLKKGGFNIAFEAKDKNSLIITWNL